MKLQIAWLLSTIIVAVFVYLAAPTLTHAQMSLESAIRTEIMKDPRSANMSEAELDAMIVALSEEAAAQGLAPSDITFVPEESGAPVEQDTCADSWKCSLDRSLGFDSLFLLLGIIALAGAGYWVLRQRTTV